VYDATIGGAISKSHDGANLAPDIRPNAAPYVRADIRPYVSAVHVGTYTRNHPAHSNPNVSCTHHAPDTCADACTSHINPVLVADCGANIVPAADDGQPGDA
jgi:hypothetical protein